MFTKKIKIANSCVESANRIEQTLAVTTNVPDSSMVHFLGQRDAYLKIYKFVMETNPKSDEIALEDILAFLSREARLASDTAFSTEIELNFPNGKRLALGQVMSYKTVEQILLNLKSDQEKQEDSDSD